MRPFLAALAAEEHKNSSDQACIRVDYHDLVDLGYDFFCTLNCQRLYSIFFLRLLLRPLNSYSPGDKLFEGRDFFKVSRAISRRVNFSGDN